MFVPAMKLAALPPGGGVPVEIHGRTIAVFNAGGAIHAVDNRCPHRGAPLVDGALEGTVVTCPWHRWQFDLSSGCNPMNAELRVGRYETEVRGDEIWIDVPPALADDPGARLAEQNRT